MRAAPTPPPLPDWDGNRKARLHLDLLVVDSDEWRQRVYERCRRSFTYWANHFCFAYNEHGLGDAKKIPLVMYDFQAEMAETIVLNVWRCASDPHARWNAGADKARKMTATFTALLISQWFAQFHGISTIITSKDDREVDIQGNMNSPFERLRWQVEAQWDCYPWLFPLGFNPYKKACSKTKLINFGNGGQIAGVAPVGKAMRQGRALIWIADEFGFVEHDAEVWEASAGTVKVRLAFSTPNGPNCKFYRLVHKEPDPGAEAAEEFHLFELDWFKHPEYAQGLYYKPDGTLSSPYMDSIIATNTPRIVAKEYLRDHNEAVGGLIFRMFNAAQSARILTPDSAVKTIYRCWDPGLDFAITWGQEDRYGRLLILHELHMHKDEVSKGTTLLKAIAERALDITDEYYSDWNIVDIGDPYASRQQISSQAKTEYELLYDLHKIRVLSSFMRQIAPHERKTKRIEILGDLMSTAVETEDGEVTPKFLIDVEKCPKSIKAIKERYRYKCDDNGTPTDEIPDNHPWTDVADCIGMTAIKLFDGRKNKGPGPTRPTTNKKQWRPSQPIRMRPSRYA